MNAKLIAAALIFTAIASAFYAGSIGFGFNQAAKPAPPRIPTGDYTLSLQPATCTSISQFGITWTFDKAYECGQFANGDYWVVGPVTIVGITPTSTVTDGRTMHGSMIDPVGSLGKPPAGPSEYGQHGFDSTLAGWLSSLNVGRPNGNTISAENSLVIEPSHSLISSISNAAAGVALVDAAILTILGSAPDLNSFRPAYAGGDKTIRFNISDLDYSSLQNLEPVGSEPSLATVEALFKRPWLDWQYSVVTLHTVNNPLRDYAPEAFARVGEAALLLQLNYTEAEKEPIMIGLAQLGIDLYGVLINNGRNTWMAAGGINNGRKLPILFAGKVLNDLNMSGIGSKSGDYLYEGDYWPDSKPPEYHHFGEDDQTFYVAAEDIYSQPYELKWTTFTGSSGSITGRVKVTYDSNVVEGVGTNWSGITYGPNDYLSYSTKKMFAVKNDVDAYLTERPVYQMGDYWVPDYVIKSIDSATQLTLTKPYHGDTNQTGNAEYAISFRVWYGHGHDKYLVENKEYTNEHLGLPEWGGRHQNGPDNARLDWGSNYRGTAGKGFAALALPALMMDLKELWNHDAFFDYTDRHMDIMVGQSSRTVGRFERDMWDAYRANYGCVWTSDDPTDIYSQGHYNCNQCKQNCLSSPYCGDGTCNGTEDSKTCAWDCKTGTECSDGQTKQCGTTDIGECAFGTQTCINSTWGQCTGAINPTTESTTTGNCSDAKDNDCDGKTDTADEECQATECTLDSDCPTGQTCKNSVCTAECIDNTKLGGFISEWKQGNITMLALMQKMKQWKAGTGC